MFKALLLLGDIFTTPRIGLTCVEFAAYLFSLRPFTALILSQLGIIASGLAHI
ncbi:hypothetical protein HRbin02_00547 [Candidatus Calditenuaceae archaeon HR02]|nr:hypothetical protein HRbin02_00547 [Candidatus Calditenuaceae archaeon HR02]